MKIQRKISIIHRTDFILRDWPISENVYISADFPWTDLRNKDNNITYMRKSLARFIPTAILSVCSLAWNSQLIQWLLFVTDWGSGQCRGIAALFSFCNILGLWMQSSSQLFQGVLGDYELNDSEPYTFAHVQIRPISFLVKWMGLSNISFQLYQNPMIRCWAEALYID